MSKLSRKVKKLLKGRTLPLKVEAKKRMNDDVRFKNWLENKKREKKNQR